MRLGTAGAMLALGLVVAARPLAAQDEATLTVQVVNAEDIREVGVSRSTGALRESLGRAAGNAPLVLNMNRINFGKGKQVAVNTHQGELVLIEEGTVDQRCEEAKRGDRNQWCEEVAVLMWGESAQLGVSSSAGVLRVTTRQPTTWEPRVRVGLSLAAQKFYRLNDVACDDTAISGLTSCDSESSSISWGAEVEYRLSDWFAIGASYRKMSYTVNQVYGMDQVRHEVRVGAMDVFGRFNVMPGAKVRPWGMLGWSYYDNEDDVYWDDDPFETRGQGGPRILIGGGMDLRLLERIDLRALVQFGGGAKRDSDSNYGFGVGVGYNF